MRFLLAKLPTQLTGQFAAYFGIRFLSNYYTSTYHTWRFRAFLFPTIPPFYQFYLETGWPAASLLILHCCKVPPFPPALASALLALTR